jgi:hypothetical protein
MIVIVRHDVPYVNVRLYLRHFIQHLYLGLVSSFLGDTVLIIYTRHNKINYPCESKVSLRNANAVSLHCRIASE